MKEFHKFDLWWAHNEVCIKLLFTIDANTSALSLYFLLENPLDSGPGILDKTLPFRKAIEKPEAVR